MTSFTDKYGKVIIMGINVSLAVAQARKVSSYSSDLIGMKSKVLNERADLNLVWQSDEMRYVNSAIEKLNQRISKLSSELNSISSDIVSVAYEIKREEEAREAAARAAAQKAAEEAARKKAEAEAAAAAAAEAVKK